MPKNGQKSLFWKTALFLSSKNCEKSRTFFLEKKGGGMEFSQDPPVGTRGFMGVRGGKKGSFPKPANHFGSKIVFFAIFCHFLSFLVIFDTFLIYHFFDTFLSFLCHFLSFLCHFLCYKHVFYRYKWCFLCYKTCFYVIKWCYICHKIML